MPGIVPTPEEVDKAYKRIGMLFCDLMSAFQDAKNKQELLSADTAARYEPIRLQLLEELDAAGVAYSEIPK